jgi:hypothetical protein
VYINSNVASTGISSGFSVGLNLSGQIFCAGGMDSMSPTYSYQGLISEIMVFDRTLKFDEAKSINSYLGKKIWY